MVGLVAIGLLTGATPAPTGSPDDPPTTAPGVDVPSPSQSTAEADAIEQAQKTGAPVTVTSETTETNLLEALPDGTLRMTSSSVPVRAQTDQGWKPLDLDLGLLSNDLWAPSNPATPVRFSNGGTDVLAKVRTDGGAWVTETWEHGDLPAPTVADDTATYRGVLPDVDLVLRATPIGMSEVLVVKNETAAKNPDLASITLGVTGAQLSQNSSHTSVATTGDGTTVLAAEPTWWDSASAGSDIDGPTGVAGLKPVPHSLTSSTATLDASPIADASDVTYPVFIDPDWSTGANAYWFDDQAYPGQSYLNGNQADGIQSTGYGIQNGTGYLSRAFWQFNVAPLSGKTIQAAQLGLTELWSNSCDTTAMQLWRYGPGTPGFTWSQDQANPGAWAQNIASVTAPCDTGGTAQGVGFNAQAGVAWAASSGQGTLQFGLRSANEGNSLTRKHWAQGASLVVTYDTPPTTPIPLGFSSPARGCGSAGSPVYVNGTQALYMLARGSDVDGGNMNTFFRVYTTSGATLGTKLMDAATPMQAQGFFSLSIGANALIAGTYAWVAQSTDGAAIGATSSPCYFTVINNAPATPTITVAGAPGAVQVTSADQGSSIAVGATDHPNTGSATVGAPVQVTFTSPAGTGTAAAAAFEYWWVQAKATAVPVVSEIPASLLVTGPPGCSAWATNGWSTGAATVACATAGTATVTVTPPNSTATLWVAAFDAAGNIDGGPSSAVPFAGQEFTAAAAGGATYSGAGSGHAWETGQLDTAPSSVADSSSAGALTLPVGVSGSGNLTTSLGSNVGQDPSGNGLAFTFDGASTSKGTVTSQPPLNTSSSFTAGAWLYPTVSPTSTSKTYTALAQSGWSGPAFEVNLVSSTSSSTWQFCVATSESLPLNVSAACATATATLNQWTYVSAQWDAVTGQASIFLGTNVATPAAVTTVKGAVGARSTGAFTLGGAAVMNSATQVAWTQQWAGQILDPSVFPALLTADTRSAVRDCGVHVSQSAYCPHGTSF